MHNFDLCLSCLVYVLASAMKIFDACLEVLEKQDGILENSHIYHVKVLEIAFDACVESNQWADAITIGKQLIEPYKYVMIIMYSLKKINYSCKNV